MKKNLRIVSAAAAALLAVAPVAATVVPAASTTVSAAADKVATKKVVVANDGSWLFTLGAHNLAKHEGNIAANTELTVEKAEVPASITVNNSPRGVSLYKIVGGANDGKYIQVTDTKAPTPTYTAGEKESEHSYMTATEKGVLSQEGAYANGSTIYAGQRISSNIKSLKDLRAAVEKLVWFGYDSVENGNKVTNQYNKTDWKNYVWADNSATNKANLISQLGAEGISVKSNGDFDPQGKSYSVQIRSNNSNTVTVVFENTGYVDEDAPVIIGYYNNFQTSNNKDTVDYDSLYSNRAWQPVSDKNGYVRPLIIKQHDDGNFQPTQFFGAWNSNDKHGQINVTVKSSNVDWTKPGLYSVELTATNAAKKTTDATVPVIVTAKNGNVMTVVNNTNVYTEQNGAMVQANLVNFAHLVNPGHQVTVYGSAVTKKLNGQDTQFFRIISPTANFYIPAKDLKNGVVSTPAQETTKTVTIMHISTIYDKNGKATHEPALRAYDTYSVVATPVNLKDEKGKDAGMFYKLAGKDQYIKVGNVDGTSRSLKKNSYVYKSTGKAYMKSKKHHRVLKAGSSVKTYGKSFMIAGHQMYRIGKNQYVKKANF